MSHRILVVDDDPVQRRLLEASIQKLGHCVDTAPDGDKAIAYLRANQKDLPSAIILDLIMPGTDGLSVMATMAEDKIDIPVIVQTAKGGVDVAVSAMRAGAFDFCVKPASTEKLAKSLADALKVSSSSNQLEASPQRKASTNAPAFIGSSEAVSRVLGLVRKAAASDIPVLVEGESGTGKELIARSVQAHSARQGRPFVIVNCGAIPENLVESILFGHEKGAFTGATEKHTGKFVEAHGGTLFLDEIGDLPLEAQVKVLRAIQDGEVEPVGARASKKVNVRLISATNRDLIAAVREARFREDLYYRLNVFPIMVPPLRYRKDDIAQLADHFIETAHADGTFSARKLSPAALDLLLRFDWPGNVRQLQNAIFRAVVLCEDDILDEKHFPQIAAQVEGIHIDPVPALSPNYPECIPGPLPRKRDDITTTVVTPDGTGTWLNAEGNDGQIRTLTDVEAELIGVAIGRYRGRMSEVARRLGIGRSTLYRKLKEHAIEPKELL